MPIDTAPSALAPPAEAPVHQQWGWVVPVACAVHCAAAPFLVTLLPALAGGEEWEWLFLVASGALGWSIFRRLPRERGKGPILALGLAGVALWAASLLSWTAPVPEAVSSGAGALILASAMLMGSHSHAAREVHGCGCSACETPTDFRHRGVWRYLPEGMRRRR